MQTKAVAQSTPRENFIFRLASEDDQRKHAPGMATRAYQKAQAILNTASLGLTGGDLYRFFGKPIPKGMPCKVINTLTGLNWFVFSSPEMFSSISNEFRHNPEGLFANDVAAQTFIDIGSEIFGEKLNEEDTITTCRQDKNKEYRILVSRHLGSNMMKPRLPEIDKMAHALFDELKPDATEVDITEVCQKLVSRIINKFLLGLDDKDSLAVSKAIVAANSYILAKASGFADKKSFDPHAEVLLNAINKALENDTPFVKELNASKLTDLQKKVMIIVIYFTSLGGTISQISGLMWHLAKNPKYQEELFQEIASKTNQDNTGFAFTKKLLDESFRTHQSTLTLDRPTGRPLLLTYSYGDKQQEILIPEKTIMTFYQPWAAELCEDPKVFNPHRNDQVEMYPFGNGVHMCVAKFFAEELIGRFARAFTSRFESSSELLELPLQGYFNLEPKTNVKLSIRPRPTMT